MRPARHHLAAPKLRAQKEEDAVPQRHWAWPEHSCSCLRIKGLTRAFRSSTHERRVPRTVLSMSMRFSDGYASRHGRVGRDRDFAPGVVSQTSVAKAGAATAQAARSGCGRAQSAVAREKTKDGRPMSQGHRLCDRCRCTLTEPMPL